MKRIFLIFVACAAAFAQAAPLKIGATYDCPAIHATIKVFSCKGPAETDLCDIQTTFQGNPQVSRAPAPRRQVEGVMPVCQVRPAPAKASAAKTETKQK